MPGLMCELPSLSPLYVDNGKCVVAPGCASRVCVEPARTSARVSDGVVCTRPWGVYVIPPMNVPGTFRRGFRTAPSERSREVRASPCRHSLTHCLPRHRVGGLFFVSLSKRKEFRQGARMGTSPSRRQVIPEMSAFGSCVGAAEQEVTSPRSAGVGEN